jgi:hypothetical protein
MSHNDEREALLALTKEELDKQKVASEIVKLGAEIKKLRREHELIAKHPLTLPSGYVPLLVALIALAGVVVKWRLDAITAQTREVEKSSQVMGLEAALAKAAPTLSIATVHIRFRGSIKRELVTAVQQSLNSDGFIAPPPVRTAEVQSTLVAYYDAADMADAEKVAEKATEVFRASGCSISPVPKLIAPNVKATRTIELDIYTTCQ